uniref:Putative conserved secreted protein n=1 Tax=Ixodes ricinus TaxID=34613 RepID=A0A6B0URF7_IXORI
MKTLCAAFVFAVVVAEMLVDCDSPVAQVPVVPPGVSTRPPGKVGEPCTTGADCRNGTCCRQGKRGGKTCRRLRKTGELCSDSPIKGSIYIGQCPCLLGLQCIRDQDQRCYAVPQSNEYPTYTKGRGHIL